MKRVIIIFCAIVFCAGASCAAEYDPLHTMLALNTAIVSVNRISSAENRIVLEEEYNRIINRFALANIESDPEITELYEELLDFITAKKLRQEDAEKLREHMRNVEQEAYYKSLSKAFENLQQGTSESSSSLMEWFGKLAISAVSSSAAGYYDYNLAKIEAVRLYSNDIWSLTREDITACNALQKKLLNASWKVQRKYKLPEEYRLTQENLGAYFRAVEADNPALKTSMLKALERRFKVYPPYWYYRALSALEAGDGEEAGKCFDKFDEVWRPVVNYDPCKLGVLKYRIGKIAGKRDFSRDDEAAILNLLEVFREYTHVDDWRNNIFSAAAYFIAGDKDNAVKCLQINLDFANETEMSRVLIKQIKAGKIDLSELSDIKEKISRLKSIRRAAFAGNAQAQDEMGSAYYEGKYIEQDYGKALFWYKKAAEKGNLHAQFALAFMHHEGQGAAKNDKWAVYWWYKSAKQGYADSQYMLWMCYKDGRGVEASSKNAYYWLMQAAKNKSICVEAHHMAGRMYYYGDLGKQDYSEAVKWLTMAAEEGSSGAQALLGEAYHEGHGVPQDKERAAYWYKKSAAQNNSEGLMYLGYEYILGDIVSRDVSAGINMLRKSAEQECKYAYYRLGMVYYSGVGVESDYSEAASWYKLAAESGIYDAQYRLALMFESGEGVVKDYERAVYWMSKAAGQNNSNTRQHLSRMYFLLGKLYYDRRSRRYDPEKGLESYRQASDLGNSKAQYALGELYHYGYSGTVRININEAVKYYRMSALQGNADAQYALGNAYYDGLGVEADRSKALSWYMKAGSQDNSSAQYMAGFMLYSDGLVIAAMPWLTASASNRNKNAQSLLGVMYYEGKDVPRDYVKAVELLRQAAEQGDSEAQYYLGNSYRNGNGVSRDSRQAIHWWRKSADQGNAKAEDKLGLSYYYGWDDSQVNYSDALAWWKLSGGRGFVEAQVHLGDAYYKGKGTAKDMAKAFEWYMKAAVQDHARAECMAANMYYNGEGISRNIEESIVWYRKSAENGYAEAQYRLGYAYHYGVGVGQDHALALFWYKKAADQGNNDAKKAIKLIK